MVEQEEQNKHKLVVKNATKADGLSSDERGNSMNQRGNQCRMKSYVMEKSYGKLETRDFSENSKK